ncbi:hypothetical protein D3C72_1335230 [compost metagenome]
MWYTLIVREMPSFVKYGSVVVSDSVRLYLLVLTCTPRKLPEPNTFSCEMPKVSATFSALE